MFKIILLFLLVFQSIFNVKASSGSHTGFSTGFNLGYQNIDGKLNHDLILKVKEEKFTPSLTMKKFAINDIGSHSSLVGFFLGYGVTPSVIGVYLGGEIFLQYGAGKINNQFFDFETRFQTNNSFGAVSKIGYIHKDTLFFIKSGFVSMDYKNSSFNRANGYLIGLGMDYPLSRHWFFGGEFVYEIYGHINTIVPSCGYITFKPKISKTNIRLKYNF